MQAGPDRPVRLEDVARQAGVSTATVSHALRDKGRISPGTRAHVRDVARRMGYRPNAAARRLAGGRVGLIALTFSVAGPSAVNVVEVDYFNQVIRAATARALTRDFALVVAPPTSHAGLWARVPLDGVIVFDPVAGDPILAELRGGGTPLVLSGRDPAADAAGADFCVDNDHAAGTRAVLDHLRSRGARRIALLAADLGDTFTADCVETYRAWCDEQGQPAEVALVTDAGREEATARLFRRSPRPDAVYATVEGLGVTAVNAAVHAGLGVPDDLLVAVAADREPEGAAVPLTTLELDPVRTAEEAVDMLIEVIEGRSPAERTRLIPTRLVPRASTAATGRPAPRGRRARRSPRPR